jgi:hypothetical protein
MGYKIIGEPFSIIGRKIGTPGNIGFQWIQSASFEGPAIIPNPTGFDAIAGAAAGLAINAASAMRGNFGLQVSVAGGGSEAYGRFTGLNNETRLTFEFLFDPSNLVIPAGDNFNMIVTNSIAPASPNAFILIFQNAAGVINFLALAKNDAGGNVFPWQYNVRNVAEKIRIEWQAASEAGANDGVFGIYSDDVLQAEVANLDTDTHAITEIQIGAVAGLDALTNGQIYFDNIRWARQFIGG